MINQTPVTPPATPGYPATLSIDYPDRPLNRLTSFFRLFVVLPIIGVLAALSGPVASYSTTTATTGVTHAQRWGIETSGILFLAVLLMILFRQKYPKWWFDWNLMFTRFSTRVGAYFALLRDEYPSTDEEQAVHLDLIYPDAKALGRGMPLVKWFLAIPHYFVLAFLAIAAFFAIIFAWFAILFTGRYPKGLFDYVVGVERWGLRVSAYAFLLITDEYPPFSLNQA